METLLCDRIHLEFTATQQNPIQNNGRFQKIGAILGSMVVSENLECEVRPQNGNQDLKFSRAKTAYVFVACQQSDAVDTHNIEPDMSRLIHARSPLLGITSRANSLSI